MLSIFLGNRSVVRKLKDEKEKTEACSPLKYLGITVILGLSATSHPLVQNRGFYVLDGTHRLFTMPFAAPTQSNQGNA